MATVRQLITRTLRMLGVVGEGNPAPSAYDAQRALETLRHLYTQLIANGAFYPLTDVVTDEAYEAGENERVINAAGVAIDITLPLTIETTDPLTGATTDRAPYDRSAVLVTGVVAATYLYDADVADWLSIEDLTLESAAPLSVRYGTGLAALLAMELAPEFGVEPGGALVSMANDGSRALYIKRPMTATLDAGLHSRNWRIR